MKIVLGIGNPICDLTAHVEEGEAEKMGLRKGDQAEPQVASGDQEATDLRVEGHVSKERHRNDLALRLRHYHRVPLLRVLA